MGSLRAPNIPSEEFTFSTSRSGGPGGQNVNKVNTRVTVSFDVGSSPSLSEEQREKLKNRIGSRISRDGILQVSSQTYRSQFRNREDALARIQFLIASAFVERRRRVKTRPTRSSIRKRLETKARRSQLKRLRQKGGEDS